MKKVLVLFYSQTGQLKEILTKLFSELDSDITIDYVEIKAPQFSFPLNWQSMFNLFPESVLQVPCDITYELPNNQYDVVVLGFQTWFLHLSLPMLTFSHTEDFANLIKNKHVYLIMDCRNSWRYSMKYMEEKVSSKGGYIKGKCVFGSIGSNFIGSISILHWFFTGNKKLFLFPEPGVPQAEIDRSAKYGKYILLHEHDNRVIEYPIGNSHFMPLKIEKNVTDKFKHWATYITADNNKYRKKRLRYFRIWLIFTITILSPFIIVVKLINNRSQKQK